MGAGRCWNGYNFPLYSSALKSLLGFNQQQLTLLGVANDIGESVGLIPGIVINKLPPWLSFLCENSFLINIIAFLLWLALVVATNSNAWFGTAVLVTNMRNFPLSRGTVSGILKGYVGISAAVYTVLFNMALGDSASKLLLFLTLGIPIICLAMMFFIRPCTPASGEDSSVHVHFVFTQAASIVLALYLLISTIISDLIPLSDTLSYILVAIMVIFLMSPLAIPVKMTLFPVRPKNHIPATDSLIIWFRKKDASDIEILLAVGEGAVKKKRKPKRGEDFTFVEALIKADFWLVWVVCFLGVGSGVTVLNNLAQIGFAYGLDDTTILLAVFSFCNFVGRLGSGAVSEHFVRSKTIPRTLWMTCAQLIMVVIFILLALALDGILFVATAVIGVCYGILYSVTVPTVSELFGLKHFGIIYAFMSLGNPIGALLFSGLLAGYVYDAEATKQGSSTCVGPDCFKVTFLVLAGICGLGTILSIILTVRLRPVYQMLYAGGSFHLPQSSGH
ncbi:hypothetical protein GH714_033525 [Hevea brasiliensis]|uniref:Uncharacterized protein n=1 Tax=Hevea brasiliensis TaxID=3981 RepID=A0A6A6NE47_HEVBR|nr:hypothetical protein GH714_033525 [Hevea brasiliensis]